MASDTRASECGLTECRGRAMCQRCQHMADMDALCGMLPEGVSWGDPLTPDMLREILASASKGAGTPAPAAQPAEFDDGSRFALTGWAGGASKAGVFSTVTCEHTDAAGQVTVMHYVRSREEMPAAQPAQPQATGPLASIIVDIAQDPATGALTMGCEKGAPAAQPPCPHCDDTGDVHGRDGEWRGVCSCPAGQKMAAQPAQAEPVAPLRAAAVVCDQHVSGGAIVRWAGSGMPCPPETLLYTAAAIASARREVREQCIAAVVETIAVHREGERRNAIEGALSAIRALEV